MLFLAAALLALAPQPPPVRVPEMRGLWVVRTALVSPEQSDQVVDHAAEAGFNALFVQVRGRGDAFYHSRIVPRSPLLEKQPAGFDPLARLIERARARGLSVHAWVNVLLAAGFGASLPPQHVVLRNPDWLMVPRSAARAALAARAPVAALVREASRSDADTEGYYLSPAHPGVGEHLEEVVRELVRGYPVDGLHLDFIRYPGREFDYSRASLEGFRRREGGGDPLDLPARAPAAFAEYRRSVLTALAQRLARAARRERPGVVVSAAVVPDEAAAQQQKFQDWPAWSAGGILDAVCPMVYTPDTRIYREQLAQARALVGPQRTLWAGVGAYRLSLDGTIERIGLARLAGAKGVVVFSHESIPAQDLKRLRDGAFGASGPTPYTPPVTVPQAR